MVYNGCMRTSGLRAILGVNLPNFDDIVQQSKGRQLRIHKV